MFKIVAIFEGLFSEEVETKTEFTDNYQAAFGAFTIYALHSDCIRCCVFRTATGKCILDYRPAVLDE